MEVFKRRLETALDRMWSHFLSLFLSTPTCADDLKQSGPLVVQKKFDQIDFIYRIESNLENGLFKRGKKGFEIRFIIKSWFLNKTFNMCCSKHFSKIGIPFTKKGLS